MKMSKFNDTYNKIISEMAEKKLVKESECKCKEKECKEKEEIVNEDDDMGGDESADVSVDEGGDM